MTIQRRLTSQKQAPIAAQVGVSAGYLSEVARNRKAPSVQTIARLARTLEISDAEIGASVLEWADLHAGDSTTLRIHKESPLSEPVAVAL